MSKSSILDCPVFAASHWVERIRVRTREVFYQSNPSVHGYLYCVAAQFGQITALGHNETSWQIINKETLSPEYLKPRLYDHNAAAAKHCRYPVLVSISAEMDHVARWYLSRTQHQTHFPLTHIRGELLFWTLRVITALEFMSEILDSAEGLLLVVIYK